MNRTRAGTIGIRSGLGSPFTVTNPSGSDDQLGELVVEFQDEPPVVFHGVAGTAEALRFQADVAQASGQLVAAVPAQLRRPADGPEQFESRRAPLSRTHNVQSNRVPVPPLDSVEPVTKTKGGSRDRRRRSRPAGAG